MWWDTDGYGHMSGWGMGWGGGLLMVLVFLALVAIVVAVVVAIVRTTGPGTPSSGSAPRQRAYWRQWLVIRLVLSWTPPREVGRGTHPTR